MQRNIIMLKGLPASGKSTYARQLLKDKPGHVRVNKDDLRAMMHNGWSKTNEAITVAARDAIIEAALMEGSSVIVDDTNLVARHERRLRELAAKHNAGVEIVDFTHVPLDECLKRDRQRPNGVGADVILRMWRDHLKPPTPKIEDNGLPKAIIVDLDGTLADPNGRNPYDASTADLDLIREPVLRAVTHEATKGTWLIFCSGRQDKDREPTVRFLERCGLWGQVTVPHFLYMRQTGDSRADTVVKEEIYRDYIEGRFSVVAAYDDRPCVVRLWRGLGIFTFDCGDGIEF